MLQLVTKGLDSIYLFFVRFSMRLFKSLVLPFSFFLFFRYFSVLSTRVKIYILHRHTFLTSNSTYDEILVICCSMYDLLSISGSSRRTGSAITFHDSSSLGISWTSSGCGRGVAWSKFLIVELSADLIFRARCAEGGGDRLVGWSLGVKEAEKRNEHGCMQRIRRRKYPRRII